MSYKQSQMSWQQKLAGWFVHAFTASGAFVGLLALLAIYEHRMLSAFWLMGVATIIDGMDGFLARKINIKRVVPNINGELLDNIVDFLTYVIVPCFFLLVSDILPPHWRIVCVLAITFASAYQFTQIDAKTEDHFFKGFPSYWNLVLFYLFFWQINPWANLAILLLLSILSFVPIKYIYPSRLNYLTNHSSLRFGMVAATLIFALSTAGLAWLYPSTSLILNCISMSYMTTYILLSLYRTFVPLVPLNELDAREETAAQYI